ncbi:MAG: CoA-transferase, partial [Mariniphaga sp.]
MDLVASARNIIVAMMHTNPQGEPKLLKKCTLPLTGVGVVKRIVSDLAVIDVTPLGFKLIERATGISVHEIINAKDGKLIIPGLLQPIKSVNLLNDKSLLKTKSSSSGLEISVPEKAPNEIASVVKVTLKDKFNVSSQGAKKKMKTGELD